MEKATESKMLSILSKAKNVLLLEPSTGRYPPLALAKISTFVRRHGGIPEFSSVFSSSRQKYDLVTMTTLFTYDSASYRTEIAYAGECFGDKIPVLVGGVCASLAPKSIKPERKPFGNADIRVFAGFSPELDSCIPDQSIDWGDRGWWGEHSYAFTSRGCPNRCPYCAVPRLERTSAGVEVVPNWREHLPRKTCVIMDNNVTSAPGDHLAEVVDFLVENEKTVIFENGIDCKHVDTKVAKMLGNVKWAGNGLRIAFDRIEEDGVFQSAIQCLLDHGVGNRKIMSYVLFNFIDTPKDAEYRLLECARMGVQPYPQKFVPLNRLDRKKPYVGKHWTKKLGDVFAHYGIMGKFRVKGSKTQFVSFRDFVQRDDVKKRFNLQTEDLNALGF